MTVTPATLNVPEREGPLVGAAFTLTVPLPLPLAPEVMESQEVWLSAVHAHPAPAVTFTLALPPADPIESVSGATANVQPGDWVTVKVWPAMVAVPVRVGPVVGATVTPTLPLPLPPPDGAVREIQLALLAAVQGQPGPAVTVTDVDPPLLPAAYVAGLIV